MDTFLDPIVFTATLDRLRRLQPDSPGKWGRMNAHQMVCHLHDSFRLGLGERAVSPASGVLQRAVIKTIALRVPLPWPKGVQTRPEADQELGGTPPHEFVSDMGNLIGSITRFARARPRCQDTLHPIFGKMSEWEWMRWGYLHTDHHLRQFGL
ncbi:MAG: DUF1569 domain-containing protein [Acidobacteria bacterium]|nr:DUF1569 domain-containing protein [Acidobacteriota bacterium]